MNRHAAVVCRFLLGLSFLFLSVERNQAPTISYVLTSKRSRRLTNSNFFLLGRVAQNRLLDVGTVQSAGSRKKRGGNRIFKKESRGPSKNRSAGSRKKMRKK